VVQRGRKSANGVAHGLIVDGSRPRLQAPTYMNAGERKLFKELLASVATKAFVDSDLPLLTSFVQATLLARKTARNPKLVGTWEKAVRAQAMLATRLRISPQSRYDARAAARATQVHSGPKPWEDEFGNPPWKNQRQEDDGDVT
jgi:hypothetical protein